MIKYLSLLILFTSSVNVIAQVDTLTVLENGQQRENIILQSEYGNDAVKELKSFYSNNGFFDAEISFQNNIYAVNTGQRFKIKELNFQFIQGPSTVDSEVSSVGYSSELIERRIELLYEEIVDQGFRNSELSMNEFRLDSVNKTVSISVSVDRGKLIRLFGIIFTGNKINSQKYLTKVSRMSDSLIANKQNLDRIRQNLIGSELFELVSEPKVYEESGNSILLVEVQERVVNQFDGLIGYVPDASGEGQIIGDLDISLWNVLRDGNSFELMYQRLRPETSRIQLSTSQDWIANIPLKIGVDFSLYQNDTTYQTRNLGLYSSYWVASDFKLNGRVYSTTSNSNSETGVQQEPDGSKQGSDLGFTYSSLNRVEVPRKGIKIDLVYGIASKNIENDSSVAFRQQRIETRINTYMTIFKNSVLATSINGFYIIADEFTESDLVRFGGANSLRGYAEEQFLASELLWGDIEYRFLTDQDSYLFLFTAAGFYNRPQLYSEVDNSFVQKDFLYSGGFGLSYKTAIGRLKFSYALSPSETIGNGKIHFGLRTSL